MINNPTGSQANRLVFLSPVLTHDLHVSGTPLVELQASFNKTSANVGALLVDYSAFAFVTPTRAGGGVRDTTDRTCWGDSTAMDSACYPEVTKPTLSVTSWRVSKGILDAGNRDSLFTPTPLVAGQPDELAFPLLPNDYVFPAGHQIGVILVSNYSGYGATTNTTAPTAQVTVDTRLSKVVLPVVGGDAAALASGAFASDTTAPELHLPGPVTVEATGPATSVTVFRDRHGRHGPEPDGRLHAYLRRGVCGRHDDRPVHGDRRERQRRDRLVHGHGHRHDGARPAPSRVDRGERDVTRGRDGQLRRQRRPTSSTRIQACRACPRPARPSRSARRPFGARRPMPAPTPRAAASRCTCAARRSSWTTCAATSRGSAGRTKLVNRVDAIDAREKKKGMCKALESVRVRSPDGVPQVAGSCAGDGAPRRRRADLEGDRLLIVTD